MAAEITQALRDRRLGGQPGSQTAERVGDT